MRWPWLLILLAGCDVLAPLPSAAVDYGWDGSERIPACADANNTVYVDPGTCSETLVTRAWPHLPCRWCVGQDGCSMHERGAAIVCVASCDDPRCVDAAEATP